ncbi:hypothetical protein ACWD2L_00685 [Streptomyces sp. NPDC002754]
MTSGARMWRHDHAAQRRVVCPGVGRPAANIVPRQLEFTAEQLRLVDLVDEHGALVAFGVPVDETAVDDLFSSAGLLPA